MGEINWPDDLGFITYRSNSCVLDEKELEAQIKMSMIMREQEQSVSFFTRHQGSYVLVSS